VRERRGAPGAAARRCASAALLACALLPHPLAATPAARIAPAEPTVRVEVLGLLHAHEAVIGTPRGELRVRAVGDQLHEGVGPPRRTLRIEAPAPRERPLSVKVDKLARRAFAGALELRAHEGELSLVNELPLEEYVASVVGAELPHAPAEAQKALAVVVRSFALNTIARSHASAPRAAEPEVHLPPALAHPDAPLCDQTHCQLYLGLGSASKRTRAAAEATRGRVLLLPSGKVAPALHHAACGGRTATARDVWPGATADDQLASASIDDHLPGGAPACASGPGDPPLAWSTEVSPEELVRALGTSLPLSLKFERASGPGGGWVRSVSISGGRPLGADALHLLLGRALGWNRIRSSRIYWADASSASEPPHDSPRIATAQVHATPGRFVLRGSGFGHGVGLCQRGAARWARSGETFSQILSRYFPQLTVGRLPTTPDPG